MKKILSTLLVCLATAVGMPAHGQQITQQQTFGGFVNGLPPANLPLTSGDKLYVLQNGASKSVPGNAVGASLGSPCTTTPLSLQYNAAGLLGCVAGATSNGNNVTFANNALFVGTTAINAGVGSFTATLPSATANLAYQVGALTNGNCVQASGTQGGLADSGVTCGAGGTGLTVGTTTIASGTTGRVLFDNAAVLGEYSVVPVTVGGTGSTTAFSVGSVVFAGVAGAYTQDNSNFFYSANGGPSSTPTLQVGPRGSSPLDATFEVYNPGPSSSTVHIQNAGTQSPTGGAIVTISAVPAGAAMLFGNQLGVLRFGGSINTSQTQGFGSSIFALATENWSSTTTGSNLNFYTVPNGTTTPQFALTLYSDQTAGFFNTVFAPRVNLGSGSSLTGQVILNNSTNNNTTTIQAGAASASKTYTWPLTTGAAGSILTDAAGNGVLSWSTVSGAVSSVSNSDGTLTISPTTGVVVASINLAHGNTWTAAQTITPTLTLGVASTTSGQLILLNNSNANTTRIQASTTAANGVLTAPALTDTLAVLGTTQTFTAAQTITPSLTLGVGSSATGQLVLLNGTNNNTVTLQAGVSSASKTYTWPLTTGSAGQVLTDMAGNGTLSWQTPSGGGGLCTVTASSLQYNNSGSFGCVTDWTSDGTVLTGALGTITTNIKALTITGTWNAGGTTFDAPLFMNITNTASAAGSALFDLQVGGVSQHAYYPNTSILAVGNSTTATGFQVYNTVDTLGGPTNYERAAFDWTSVANVLTIGTQKGGSGNARNMEFVIGGTNKFDFGVTTASTWTTPSGTAIRNVFSDGTTSSAGIISSSQPVDSSITGVVGAGGLFAGQDASQGGQISMMAWNNNASGPTLNGWKTRTAGSTAPTTPVVAGDVLNGQTGQGANGTNYQPGASMLLEVDSGGTISATSMPGRVRFKTTPNGSNTPLEALRINSLQQLVLTAITTDAAHTDATLCEDTTSHAVFFGSGAAGICLGTSSLRFKHDVAPLDVGLRQIMALEPISYKLNADHGDPDKVLYGFSAEQGETAVPQLVGRDANGQPNTFDYVGVVPVLVRAIQQQQAEIEDLKRRIH